MKKKAICLLLLFAAIMSCGLMQSCSSNEDFSNTHQKKTRDSGYDWRNIAYDDLDEYLFSEMCSERSELLEIPRYMNDSILNDVIDQLSDMSGTEFQTWYNNYSFENDILDAQLAYATMLEWAEETYLSTSPDSINFNTQAGEVADLAEAFINLLESDPTHPYTMVITTDLDTLYKPKYDMSVLALTDSYGQIIIGYDYYRYFSDGTILVMPLTTYMEIPLVDMQAFTQNHEFVDIINTMSYYNFYEANGDFRIALMPTITPNTPSNSTEDHSNDYGTLEIASDLTLYTFHKTELQGNEKYRMDVTVYAYEKEGWFHNYRETIVKVENYVYATNSNKGVQAVKHENLCNARIKTSNGNGNEWTSEIIKTKKRKSYTFRSELQFDKITNITNPIIIPEILKLHLTWEDYNSWGIIYN